MSPIRLRAATAVLTIATLVACAAPGLAAAAGEPQITSAGIDATDRFVVSWTLAPGTTFDEVDFGSSPILDPATDYTDFADLDNFAGFECTPPPSVCDGKPSQTSYRESDRVSRDRRYFVIVTARSGERIVPSALWVIDETKPLILGDGTASDTPTNTPVLGRPYVPPAPETIPAAKLSLLAPIPKTIAGFERRGIRARLSCPMFECYGFLALDLGDDYLALESGTARPDGRRTFLLRPTRARRAKLRGRSRVRLRLDVDISQPGGKQSEIVRSIDLRR